MPDGDPIIIGQANAASNPGNETSLSRNESTNRTVFVARNLNVGSGIRGQADGFGEGVRGISRNGYGVLGTSTDGHGVRGDSNSGVGVLGNALGALPAILGTNNGVGGGVAGRGDPSVGVRGDSVSGVGVRGSSSNSVGVFGTGAPSGVRGESPNQVGVFGRSSSGVAGVQGSSNTGTGVSGVSRSGSGVSGTSTNNIGVLGNGLEAGAKGESSRFGVHGRGLGFGAVGVLAEGETTALLARAAGTAVEGFTSNGIAIRGWATTPGTQAGEFQGHVSVVNGNLTVINGNKAFKIDHPLDPQNKYLLHNAVESSERKNVYDGVARLDEDGAAWGWDCPSGSKR